MRNKVFEEITKKIQKKILYNYTTPYIDRISIMGVSGGVGGGAPTPARLFWGQRPPHSPPPREFQGLYDIELEHYRNRKREKLEEV